MAAPILIVAMIVGLIISIFQATTQINEQTLAFVPKIVAILVVLLVITSYSIHYTKLYDAARQVFNV